MGRGWLGEQVAKLGGDAAVAAALGVAPSTVWRWHQPRADGLEGEVPLDYRGKFFALCRDRGFAAPCPCCGALNPIGF